MSKPTPEQIQEAGRQLQRGGSDKLANRVVEQGVDAGMDRQDLALSVLEAASDYKPRPWAR
jgi:hypothetical protein